MSEEANMNRKAQSMSFKVIIVAVLGLLVLIIVIAMFTGKARIFVNQTGTTGDTYSAQKCVIPGTSSVCRSSDDCNKMDGANLGGKKDCKSGEICCSR